MNTRPETRELLILEEIESDPDVNQATLAAQLGVAVGTANILIRNLIDKGYVKVKRAQRKKLRYIITPKGIAHRAELTVNYIDNSLRLYRRTRNQVKEFISDVRAMGFEGIQVVGNGDIAEICHLTCMEEGIRVENDPTLPYLEVRGWKVYLENCQNDA